VLVRVEPQRPRDRIQDLRRGVDVAALLEPCVPGDADPGELGDLLPAEPRRAASSRRSQSDLLRSDALAATPEERGELLAPELVAARASVDGGMALMAAWPFMATSRAGGISTVDIQISIANTCRVRLVALIPG